jgi:hypothetical protein
MGQLVLYNTVLHLMYVIILYKCHFLTCFWNAKNQTINTVTKLLAPLHAILLQSPHLMCGDYRALYIGWVVTYSLHGRITLTGAKYNIFAPSNGM